MANYLEYDVAGKPGRLATAAFPISKSLLDCFASSQSKIKGSGKRTCSYIINWSQVASHLVHLQSFDSSSCLTKAVKKTFTLCIEIQ